MFDVNLLAILVSAVVAFIIGFLFHGPLFGKLWMKLANITPTGNEKMSDMYGQMGMNFVVNILTACVIAIFINVAGTSIFMIDYSLLCVGLIVAFLGWLGFVFAGSSMEVIWMKKSWKLWIFECVSVFLTGEPGAGKTFTINRYIEYLRDRKIDYAITASTGIAATHIGGITIHSWSGIGIKKNLSPYDIDKIANTEYVNRRVRKAKVLIIDEVSMLSPETLDTVDAVCREVKNNSSPFGGIQVVLVGDFFQLPPIEKQKEENKQNELIEIKKGLFSYEASSWQRLSPVVCYIEEQHRQEDQDFLSILLSIRKNKFNKNHHSKLKSRYIDMGEIPENITKLFAHNRDVDMINFAELSKVEEDERRFEMQSEGQDVLVEILKKGCLSPSTLILKKGAVVMCTKNNQKENFVNGTLATVVDFEEFSGCPIIKTKSGRNILIEKMDWTIEDGGKIKAKISQLPLRLAWAITVHKSQGMSLDNAVVDLSGVFEYGQGYVALSRVRSLDGLYLLGLNEMAVKVHPQILEIDETFRENSKMAENTFGKLGKDELKKMHQNFAKAMGSEYIPEIKKTKTKKKKKYNFY